MRRVVTDRPLVAWLSVLSLVAACRGDQPPTFKPDDPDANIDDSSGSDSSGGDSDTQGGDSDSQGGDSDSQGGDDSGNFDDPGDVVVEGGGTEEDLAIDLTDASGDSNQGQEFYLIVANTGETELGFRIRYEPTAADAPAGAPALPAAPRRAIGTKPGPMHRGGPQAARLPAIPLVDADVGAVHEEFLVRNDLEDDLSYSPVLATLWALGDNVAIWVDDDVALDWDFDCDGVIDQPSQYDSYGFDNCDLSTIATTIDDNIIPNTRALFGAQESDIDEDGRVSILITPILNSITTTSEDETDHERILYSYAEPAVDLTDFNERTNPGSDEQEVIYVFAPDPYGFYNREAPVTIDAYTGYQVNAEVARSFTTLVSYNQHVLVNEGEAEEDWLNDAMGTLAADLCGFNATYYEDIWDYLDAPHLYPLVTESSGELTALDRGGQYLFARWLYDYSEAMTGEGAGQLIFSQIIQSTDIGTDAVSNAVGGTFGELVLKWQIALLTTGVTDDAGDPLVDPAEYPPYAPSEVLSAPPANPGGHYGANGYQVGVNIRGLNVPAADGHTDAPLALTANAIQLDGPDDYIFTPGFAFYGYTDGNYAAQIIKLTGINYDQATTLIQAQESGLVASVIRWNDPINPEYSIENIFSPTDVNHIPLPALPASGAIIRGVGELSGSGVADKVSDEGIEEATVFDTDQWLLDLTDRAIGEEIDVAIWMDRHFEDTEGTPCPEDPWIAVVPVEDLPAPTVYDVRSSECVGGGTPLPFQFPTSVLTYLYYQQFLPTAMYGEDLEDYCGTAPEDSGLILDCSNDWDGDGVIDADEPAPQSLYEQIRVTQCAANGNVEPADPYSSDWMDIDELDEDDDPTATISIGAGGRSGAEGEEAYVEVTLEGGRQYVIVVGAGSGDTGPYEISMRQVL